MSAVHSAPRIYTWLTSVHTTCLSQMSFLFLQNISGIFIYQFELHTFNGNAAHEHSQCLQIFTVNLYSTNVVVCVTVAQLMSL